MQILVKRRAMATSGRNYRVFLSAAEPSGDSHCADLIRALKQSGYQIEFVGVGGQKMADAGCELLENTTAKAAMIYKAFAQVGYFYRLIKRIAGYLKRSKIDLVIICDSPAFNFHIAKAAKKAGVKTVFYVAPQLWAWGQWRIGKLRKYCDKLCCILPFEQDWFRLRGIEVVFVGNPLVGKAIAERGSCRKDYDNFSPQRAKVALLPGSRSAEIKSLWEPMQQIAIRLKQKYSDVSFSVAALDSEHEELLRQSQTEGFSCSYFTDAVDEVVGRCDFAIVASGSVTLEVAAAGCPMVIMYQSSRVLWFLLGQWLIRTKYLSLVNILAEKELVPEFMPYFTSIEPIAQECISIVGDSDRLSQISGELVELTKPLAGEAAKKVADAVLAMLD